MPAVVSLFQGVKGWPTADLAKLLGLIHEEIHERAEHHREGGGVEAEIAKRPKVQRKAAKQPERQQG